MTLYVDDFQVCYNDLKTKWISMGPAEEKFVTYFSKHSWSYKKLYVRRA